LLGSLLTVCVCICVHGSVVNCVLLLVFTDLLFLVMHSIDLVVHCYVCVSLCYGAYRYC